MARKQSTKQSIDRLSEADGRRLAVDMLRELQGWWLAAEKEFDRRGERVGDAHAVNEFLLQQKPAIFKRYMTAARRSSAIERGFLSVLSEYMGAAMNDAPMTADAYESHVEGRLGAA